MNDSIHIHCPACGAVVSIKVQVERVTVNAENLGVLLRPTFANHTCE